MIEPKFSIIVCCYNSAKRLHKALECISKQELSSDLLFEVIIVDNNSTDNTSELAQEIWAKLNVPIAFKIVTEPLPGLANARKKGILESIGELIVFCDDDNGLAQDYLKIAFGIMQSNLKIGIIGGYGIIHTDGELPEWYDLLENCYAVGAQYEKDGDITNTRGYVWGAGMVIRKVVFQKLIDAGFQSMLSGRKGRKMMAGDDTELCILSKQLGYLIYYDSRLKYFHYIPQSRITWRYLLQLWKGFARSQVYFEMYESCFNNIPPNLNEIRWTSLFKKNATSFFLGFLTLNWYKSLFITFIENRKGYLPGLEKRKYFYRMKELLRIRFSYNLYIKRIADLKIRN